MFITSSNKLRLSEVENYTMPNHDTDKVPSDESERNMIGPSVAISDSSVNDYDSADESLVCSTPLPPLENLDGGEPVSRQKTIKSILNLNSTFKAEILKSVIINEPSSAPANGNISISVSKTNSAPAGFPNALQYKYKTQFKLNCELCGQNNLLFENCFQVLFCKKCKRTDHRTCDHAEFMSSMKVYQHHTGQGESSLRSKSSRSAIPFLSCIHCGYNDHQSDDCVYYPICELCGSYDHDTHGHNRIISLKRGIKPRNPQHITKNCETCGNNVHTTTDHNNIEWFRKRDALQAKKAETLKTSKTESSSALRSKTPTKRIFLAIATYMNFIVYKRDVKSAFLNGKLKEEVYVKQSPGFECSEFPNHVCKLDKALYGLKQAPREWYETLSTFLTEHKFVKDKYVKDLLKKYDINGSSVKSLMVPPNKLGPDLNGKAINETQYKGMIGSLMYLTTSQFDSQFSSCLYARYQENPKELHLIVEKRIFQIPKSPLDEPTLKRLIVELGMLNTGTKLKASVPSEETEGSAI
ncbi:retrovirus-related pol polyprotein from transposon TNT 1-94 [Tanacetum coccineum]